MIKELNSIRKNVRISRPVIHCITNPISITRCADVILSIGARPMMAAHPHEVSEITASASALLLNIGNISDERMTSIKKSAITAKNNGIPSVIDCVGVACSSLRRKFIIELLSGYIPDIIKGNASEIAALCDPLYSCAGVDSEKMDISRVKNYAVMLSRKYGCTVQVSGKTDIVTDGKKLFSVNNGCPELGMVTGTGCMLGALTACFLSQKDPVSAAICACGVMGVCGELAEKDKGLGTFSVSLMDRISTLSDEDFEKLLKITEFKNET